MGTFIAIAARDEMGRIEMRDKRRNKSGFTLLELLIGMIVVAIVLGFVAVSSLRSTDTMRVRAAALDVAGLINYTRNKAVTKRKLYRIQICADKSPCIFVDHPSAFAQLPLSSTNKIRHRGILLLEECENAKMKRQKCGQPSQKQEFKAYNPLANHKDVYIKGIYVQSSVGGAGSFTPVNTNSTAIFVAKPDGTIRYCPTLARIGLNNRISCQLKEFVICIKSERERLARIVRVKINGMPYVEVDTKNFCR